ncbi:hypothetical protein HHI36_005390 [Cryptolaemus montrouzieri]|uniref:Uncharacterized protein n=1 Tax=Cryptolaemus montrouzieri TaxID=559131 RepID=A0ABD2NU02_9CUCU
MVDRIFQNDSIENVSSQEKIREMDGRVVSIIIFIERLTMPSYDVPNQQFFCGGFVDHLSLAGRFKVSGKVLIAPIEGEGNFKAEIGKSRMDVYQKVKVVQKKGLDYIQPVTTNSTIKVDNPKIQLDGLFGDNQQLNKATNDVITDNIDVLFEDLKPVLEQFITDILQGLLLKTLEDQVPYDKLYPVKKD